VDTADRLGGWFGVLAFHLGVRRRHCARLVELTLGMRGPQRARVLRQAYASMGANFLAVWTIGGVDGAERHLSWSSPLWTRRIMERSHGAVVLTLHGGNWDAGGLAVQGGGTQLLVYGKELHNPAVDAALNARRQATGLIVQHARRGDRTGALKVLRALREGAWLGLLADQRPMTEEGEAAWFLGRPAWCHPGAAFFASKARVPVIPMCCLRVAAGRYRTFTARPRDPAMASTQWAMDAVSAMIRLVPGQYFWMHHRFKVQPDGMASRRNEPWRDPRFLVTKG
jgi:lauroyl/myristoyl acyltransferase